MRLNNGTATGSAGKGGGGGGRQGRDIRFEISDDLLNVPEVSSEEDQDDPSWTPPVEIGRGVNDLRNGRAGTPASTLSSLHSAASTTRTRQSIQSSSRPSTSVSQRSVRRRRETFAADEPHPYGLENRGAITKPLNRGSPSPSRVRVIEQVNYRRETTNSIVYGNGPESNVHQSNNHNARVTRSQVAQLNNANNNRSGASHHQRSAKYEQNDFLMSSDSETSDVEDSRGGAVNSSVSYAFSSAGYYLRKFFSSVCTYIYLFIVGTFVFEKWCLHVKRRDEQNAYQEENLENHHYQQHYQSSNFRGGVGGGGLNGRRHESSSTTELDYQHGDHLSSSQESQVSSSQSLFSSIRQRISNSFWNSSVSNHDPSSEDEDEVQERATQERQEEATGFIAHLVNNWDGYMVTLKEMSELSWFFIKMLLRLMLVILLLVLLWKYGSYPLALVGSGIQAFVHGVGSAFSVASDGITSAFSLVATTFIPVPVRTAQPLNPPAPYPSSMKTEKTEKANVVAERSASETIIIQKDSEATLAALKSTQETIDALKLQIASMENILKEYGVRLNAHDDSFKSLHSEIEKIILAMKAASAKEKSVEQIIEEVLSAPVGETTEGDPVTLKGLFAFLKQKEDRERISQEIDIKLRALSEDVGKIHDGLHVEVTGFKTEISAMNSRVEKLGTIIKEHQNRPEPEVDIEKLKTVILPILAAEIEKSVKISCCTRKCPEGLPLGGVSIEDIELMIKRAIAMYDADKTGLPDLALEAAGGSILSTRCTKSSELRNSVISYWGFRLWSPPNTPRTIIQPGVVPGECWAFEGSVGDVVIKLAVPAVVTAFTLEHIPKSISRYGHIDSAPKHFQVLGLQSEHDTLEVHDYGSFTYEDNDEPLQYFPVLNATARYYPIVELKILSNHGNMRHTCIYRFRVHGAIDLTRSQNGGVVVKTKPPATEEEEEPASNNINNSN